MKERNPWLSLLIWIIAIPVSGYIFLWILVYSMSGNAIIVGSPLIIALAWVVYKAIRWNKNKKKVDDISA